MFNSFHFQQAVGKMLSKKIERKVANKVDVDHKSMCSLIWQDKVLEIWVEAVNLFIFFLLIYGMALSQQNSTTDKCILVIDYLIK